MLLKYCTGWQKSEDLPWVVVQPVCYCLDHFGADLVEVRPLWQPAADHLVEVLVTSALV